MWVVSVRSGRDDALCAEFDTAGDGRRVFASITSSVGARGGHRRAAALATFRCRRRCGLFTSKAPKKHAPAQRRVRPCLTLRECIWRKKWKRR
jgi:hypothetical protein